MRSSSRIARLSLAISLLVVASGLWGCPQLRADPDPEELIPQADEEQLPDDDWEQRAGKPEIITDTELEDLVERADEQGEELRPGNWRLDPADCAGWTGWDVDIEYCQAVREAHEEAMVFTLVYDCVDNICQQARWAVLHDDAYIRLIWADDSHTTVTPGVDAYFVGSFDTAPGLNQPETDPAEDVSFPEQPDELLEQRDEIEPDLYRVNLADGRVERLASCLSPRISPDGQWVVCRDLDARLIRVPVDGGEMEVIDDPQLDDRVVYLRLPHVYPDQPWFVDDGVVQYEVVTESEPGADDAETETITVDWPER